MALVAIFAAAVVLRLVTALVDRPVKGGDGSGLVTWQPLASAATVAASSGRPVLYDFTAAWCPPCHRLDAEAWGDAGIAGEVSRLFVPARVVDRQREDGRNPPAIEQLHQRYHVNVFPTLVVADAAGREIARMEGYPGRANLQEFLADARKKTGR